MKVVVVERQYQTEPCGRVGGHRGLLGISMALHAAVKMRLHRGGHLAGPGYRGEPDGGANAGCEGEAQTATGPRRTGRSDRHVATWCDRKRKSEFSQTTSTHAFRVSGERQLNLRSHGSLLHGDPEISAPRDLVRGGAFGHGPGGSVTTATAPPCPHPGHQHMRYGLRCLILPNTRSILSLFRFSHRTTAPALVGCPSLRLSLI